MHTREAWLIIKEEKMGATEDHALTVHTKKDFRRRRRRRTTIMQEEG